MEFPGVAVSASLYAGKVATIDLLGLVFYNSPV